MPRAARGKSFKPGTAIHWSQKAAYSDIDCRDFAPLLTFANSPEQISPQRVEYDQGGGRVEQTCNVTRQIANHHICGSLVRYTTRFCLSYTTTTTTIWRRTQNTRKSADKDLLVETILSRQLEGDINTIRQLTIVHKATWYSNCSVLDPSSLIKPTLVANLVSV